MRGYYFPTRTLLIRKIFNSVEINENLDKFDNKLENGFVTTTYDGKEICKVEVSKVYYNFDFTSFSKSILSEIQKYFTPEVYSLKAASGSQEIRLVGDEVYIDNVKYKKMISIVNSTDKSKALSMNIGLIKFNLKNDVDHISILTCFSNRHYKSSLPDKIKSFSDNLINFNMDIDYHIKTIEDLKNKEVGIADFTKSMLYNEKGKLIKTMELKLRAFGKNLADNHELKNKYTTLINLTDYNLDKIENFKIKSSVIYDAYIELFKDSDTSIIARESRRVIGSLGSFL